MTEAEKIKQRNADFVQTFAGPHGERVLAYLSAFCLKRGSTFIVGSPDKSAFNEGARAVILEIDYWIEYDLSTLDETGETDNTEPERNQDE
ncbi:hypothetical protein LCGC14_2044290 [marine sediment metagenome]|uniref:Bbp19-like phage domain-containing protein n=1 Tax=marine sediment metagenome TaxID=412755 RepID=A0A0F9FDH8_9ZZZZ